MQNLGLLNTLSYLRKNGRSSQSTISGFKTWISRRGCYCTGSPSVVSYDRCTRNAIRLCKSDDNTVVTAAFVTYPPSSCSLQPSSHVVLNLHQVPLEPFHSDYPKASDQPPKETHTNNAQLHQHPLRSHPTAIVMDHLTPSQERAEPKQSDGRPNALTVPVQ